MNNEYIKTIIEQYNKNPENPEISPIEKIFLSKISLMSKEIGELYKEFQNTNKEILKLQESGEKLKELILQKQGENQGYINSLAEMVNFTKEQDKKASE